MALSPLSLPGKLHPISKLQLPYYVNKKNPIIISPTHSPLVSARTVQTTDNNDLLPQPYFPLSLYILWLQIKTGRYYLKYPFSLSSRIQSSVSLFYLINFYYDISLQVSSVYDNLSYLLLNSSNWNHYFHTLPFNSCYTLPPEYKNLKALKIQTWSCNFLKILTLSPYYLV